MEWLTVIAILFANYSEATQPISISSYRLFPFMEAPFKLFLYAKLQTITAYNSNNISQDTWICHFSVCHYPGCYLSPKLHAATAQK